MAIPTLHQTDLFRPHADPDDHWDLACVYALAAHGLSFSFASYSFKNDS
jgi:hypothetical protein